MEPFVAYLKVLTWHSFGQTDENREKSHSG